MGEESHSETFTAEEYAYLRFVRFGNLPERVLPSEMVEEIETDRPNEIPPLPLDIRPWSAQRI
ncbi:hypothetical protein [Sphaerisporangium sp. NPDC051011]|uniref:hypothetical protein n=1 Tax=Sphaerisporangium sp. NPDC051011 TaxID=3155792 RepID=UPI0033F74F41